MSCSPPRKAVQVMVLARAATTTNLTVLILADQICLQLHRIKSWYNVGLAKAMKVRIS